MISAQRSMVALALAWAVPAGAGAQQPPAGKTALVFDGVTVVDVEQGKLVPDQRVVVVGNRIETVGSASAVTMPKDAQVVDAKGKYLIPGLWDMHTHPGNLVDLFYPLFVANGVTGIRDAWSTWPIDSLVIWWREILAGTRVGPPRQLLTGRGRVSSYEDMLSRKARGANFLKIEFSFPTAEAARRTGLPFGGHVNPKIASAIEASDSGSTIIDHAHPITAGGLDKICLGNQVANTATLEQCQPVVDRLRRNNTWWVSTLIYRTTNSNRTHPTNPGAATGVVGDRLFAAAEQFWSDSTFQPRWLQGAVSVDTTDSLRFLTVAERAGLPILAGTDVNTFGKYHRKMPPGLSLHAELAIYVTEGLSPLAALQSATINPARMLRGTDSLGTVAPGKLADLVLLDANPLADITNTTTIRAVVANGRYFSRAALDSVLAAMRAKGP